MGNDGQARMHHFLGGKPARRRSSAGVHVFGSGGIWWVGQRGNGVGLLHPSPIVSGLGCVQNIRHKQMTPGPLAIYLQSTLRCVFFCVCVGGRYALGCSDLVLCFDFTI